MPLNHKRSNEPYPFFIIPLNAIFLQSPLSPPPFFDLTANFKSMLWSGLWDDIFSRNPREPNAELYLRLSCGE